MTTKNDITGDKLVTKTPTDAYREGYDRIFKKTPLDLAKMAESIMFTPASGVKVLDDEEGDTCD